MIQFEHAKEVSQFGNHTPAVFEAKRAGSLFLKACTNMFQEVDKDRVNIYPDGQIWVDKQGNLYDENEMFSRMLDPEMLTPMPFGAGRSGILLHNPDSTSDINSASATIEWVSGKKMLQKDVEKYAGRIVGAEVQINIFDADCVDGYSYAYSTADECVYRAAGLTLHVLNRAIREALTEGESLVTRDRARRIVFSPGYDRSMLSEKWEMLLFYGGWLNAPDAKVVGIDETNWLIKTVLSELWSPSGSDFTFLVRGES
jgi:hypothetical protein